MLRAAVLGVIRHTKYKTDFSSRGHRAREGPGPGMSVGADAAARLWEAGPGGVIAARGRAQFSCKATALQSGQVA